MYKKFFLLIFLLAVMVGIIRFLEQLAIYCNNRGMKLLEKGDYNLAIDYFQKSLRVKPNFPEAHYNLGVIFEERYNYEEAIDEYKKAIELNPTFLKARYNLAHLYYYKLSLYEEALKELEELLKISPTYLKANELKEEVILNYSAHSLNTGLDYLKEGDFIKAEKEFKAVLKIKPDFVVAKYNLAVLSLKRGEKEDAKEKLKEIIQENPDYPFAFRLLGSIYFDEGNFREAERYFQEVIRLMPQEAQAHNDLAQTYTKLKKYDEAIEEFQKALSLAPDNLTVLYGLASTYRDKGDYQNALFYYKRIKNLAPDYPLVDADLAGISSQLEKPKEEEKFSFEGEKAEKVSVVYLKNGRRIEGRILKETEEELVLEIKMGETRGRITIPKTGIEKVE
ncbi:MAG: tetratricopeptide repeat protein [Candidatus Omnitrophica bacterium]|nr:tetratricopeptide repeat protein [Candidatus Omnitrophota bacterium]